MWDSFQLRKPILHILREAVDGGSATGGAWDGDDCESSGRWARQAKHQYRGGILAGQRDFAVDGSGMVVDFSKVGF
jgi:hypothetical protein